MTSLLGRRCMRLYVLQRVLHNVMLGNEIFQFAAVSVLLNALCNDAETVEMDLLILSVFKVVSDTTVQTMSITVRAKKKKTNVETNWVFGPPTPLI